MAARPPTQEDETTAREEAGKPGTLKRRGLIAGAAALVAGMVAKQTTQPVEAATGSYANIGFYALPGSSFPLPGNFPASSTFGLAGSTNVGFGSGLLSNLTAGVYGFDASNNGKGVAGVATGQSGSGVIGFTASANTSGQGVAGIGPGAGDGGAGVYGAISVGAISTNSFGVHGINGSTGAGSVGVQGEGPSAGVIGRATADGTSGVVGFTNGFTPIVGVYGGTVGVSNQTSLPGVYGYHGTDGIGALGESVSHFGVNGFIRATLPTGGANTNAGTIAVAGGNSATGANGIGVLGLCDATGSSIGVKGVSGSGTGVYGQTTTGLYGVRGDAGTAPGSAGVLGYTNNVNGVAFGTIAAAPATVAGYFNGITVINGDFAVTGHKSAAVKDATGNHRLLYCVESPESWFEDFGKGQVTGGKAEVRLDPEFVAFIHGDDYGVFLTAEGDSKGLYVTNKSATGFSVREQQGGTNNLAFRWRIVAKRADIKGERLAKFTLPHLQLPDGVTLTTPTTPPAPPSQPPAPLPSPAPAPAPSPGQTSAPAPTSPLPAPAPPPRP